MCEICDIQAEVAIKFDSEASQCGIFYIECSSCGCTYADHVIIEMNRLLQKGSLVYNEARGQE